MALDANLFTLDFIRRKDSQNIVDIIDHSRPDNGVPLGSLNAATTSFASTNGSKEREKVLRLHNPDGTVTLAKQGNTFHQDFAFDWEGEQFRWRKDSSVAGGTAWDLSIIRKPDPAILAAIYRPSTKGRPALMQIFDYNLNRFDIADKRGLEVLIVLSLSLLLDMDYDDRNKTDNMYLSSVAAAASGSGLGSLSRRGASGGPSYGGAQDAERELLESSEPNEVPINPHGEVKEYVDHCISLLRSDGSHEGLSLIVLRAQSKETTGKAVKVAGEVKAAYYKLPQNAKGSADAAEDLFMYVRTGEQQAQREASAPAAASTSPTPRPRINLNAPPTPPISSRPTSPSHASYVPPTSLSIFLSKERLDEFEAAQHRLPKSMAAGQPLSASSSHESGPPALSPPLPPHPSTAAPANTSGSASGHTPAQAGKKLLHRLAGFKRSEGSAEA